MENYGNSSGLTSTPGINLMQFRTGHGWASFHKVNHMYLQSHLYVQPAVVSDHLPVEATTYRLTHTNLNDRISPVNAL